MPQHAKTDKTLSNTARSILALLNNINELVTISSQRKEAKDVMQALTIYAEKKGFKLPSEKIEGFQAILLDSRPITITYLLQDIAEEVIRTDINKQS